MDKFLVVFRGATIGEAEGPQHVPQAWDDWYAALGSALVDRGALSYGSIEMANRLLGPKLSSSAMSGYSIIAAADFDAAVEIVNSCPIFDEKGSVEIAHLR